MVKLAGPPRDLLDPFVEKVAWGVVGGGMVGDELAEDDDRRFLGAAEARAGDWGGPKFGGFVFITGTALSVSVSVSVSLTSEP